MKRCRLTLVLSLAGLWLAVAEHALAIALVVPDEDPAAAATPAPKGKPKPTGAKSSSAEPAKYIHTIDNRALVWDNRPESDDRVTWTGSVDADNHANGPGLLTWYQGKNFNSSFEGTMNHGRLEGRSISTDSTGAHAEVYWHEGNWTKRSIMEKTASLPAAPTPDPQPQPQPNAATTSSGAYVKTRNGQALVWNNDPKPGDVAEWEGQVDANGHATGQGRIRWFKGAKFVTSYEGTMVDGKLNGRTLSTDANGHQVYRNWVNGVKQ